MVAWAGRAASLAVTEANDLDLDGVSCSNVLAIDQKAAKLRAGGVTGPITQARSELATEEGVSEKTIEHGVRLARQGLVRKRKRRP